ncbi:unnamed protein product [Meganyctiphanes norvegica]|uniref:F-box domain-containing protein n=1 Tax=Meganyctiphanes norvegica TaxID=48144 RepID=A0AAV2R0Y7_MEGNR
MNRSSSRNRNMKGSKSISLGSRNSSRNNCSKSINNRSGRGKSRPRYKINCGMSKSSSNARVTRSQSSNSRTGTDLAALSTPGISQIKMERDSSHFDSLPTEILEKIFLDVPPEDIPCHMPWVCKTWSDIVQKPNYWRNRAKTLNLKITPDEWTVLQLHDDRLASERCLWMVCHIDYQQKFTDDIYPRCFLINNKGLKLSYEEEEYEEIMEGEMESFINIACAGILLRTIHTVKIHSKSPFDDVRSFSLLIKLVSVNYNAIDLLEILDDEFSWLNFKPTFINLLKSEEAIYRPLEISRFKGCLHSIDDITDLIFQLCLAIAVDENNVAIDPGLIKIAETFEWLKVFHLHVKVGTDVSTLGYLPTQAQTLSLSFTSVNPSNIDWVIMAVKKLQPRRRVCGCIDHPCLHNSYGILVFMDCLLNNKQMERMLKGIDQSGTHINWQVWATGPNLEENGDDEMSEMLVNLWPNVGEGFFRFDYNDELEYCLERDYHWTPVERMEMCKMCYLPWNKWNRFRSSKINHTS